MKAGGAADQLRSEPTQYISLQQNPHDSCIPELHTPLAADR